MATEFGLNARHGGMDNRKMPNCQPVEEVAQSMADVIANPRAEVYSREMYRGIVSKYYSAERVEDVESAPPFTMQQMKSTRDDRGQT